MFDHQDVLFMEKYKKKSARNEKWDYASPATYYVTFCTYRHNCHFGKITNRKMELNELGRIVDEEINKTFEIRNNLRLHDYVIMPNHVHLLFEIISIVETPRWGVSFDSKKWKSNSVGSIINQIKSISTKRINKIPKLFGWQSRYYDEIIKDKGHYQATKKYIQNNVRNWEKDEYGA